MSKKRPKSQPWLYFSGALSASEMSNRLTLMITMNDNNE